MEIQENVIREFIKRYYGSGDTIELKFSDTLALQLNANSVFKGYNEYDEKEFKILGYSAYLVTPNEAIPLFGTGPFTYKNTPSQLADGVVEALREQGFLH